MDVLEQSHVFSFSNAFEDMDTFVPLSWLEAAVGDWQECLDDWCFTFFSKIKSTRHWKDSSRQEYRFKKGALPRTYQFHKDIIMLPGQTQKSPPLLLDSILQLYSCFNQKHLHSGKLTWQWNMDQNLKMYIFTSENVVFPLLC